MSFPTCQAYEKACINFVPGEAYGSHSDLPQQGERYRTRVARSAVCPTFKCRRYWQEKRRNKKQWSEVVFLMMPCQAKSLQKILQLLEHSSLQMTQPEKQKILIQ